MKTSCEVVKDLLPLYHDEACSPGSKALVEEHLGECTDCAALRERMQNNRYDDSLRKERDEVVGQHNKKVMRKSLLTGICFAAILAVPILVCLIVNLAVGHALDWFFIVLTSLLLFASLTVVPLVLERRRGLGTLASFTGSLLLLLLSCCIYTKGDWFFAAAIPVLFGLCVVFLPFALHQLPLKGFASRHKGLLTMTADTLLLAATVIVSAVYGGYHQAPGYWGMAFWNTLIPLIFPWTLFLIIRYLKANGLIRAGLCTIFSGAFLVLLNDAIQFVLDGTAVLTVLSANLSAWQDSTINANIYLLMLLTGVLVGVPLVVAGIVRDRGKGKRTFSAKA